MALFIFLALLTPLITAQGSKFLPQRNERPIIGLLTLPSDDPTHSTDQYSYVGASYVKFIESAGARVVPILYDYDELTLIKLFYSVNGLLFPGGDPSLWQNESTKTGFAKLTRTAQFLLNLAIEANSRGDFFPVWGTCLGYEMILMSVTNYDKELNDLYSPNHSSNLNFLNLNSSRVFGGISPSLLRSASENPLFYYFHHYGKKLDEFRSDKVLNEFFNVIASSIDLNGTEYVAFIESKEFPIYGSQFHPEISVFEWQRSVNATHNEDNIEISHELATFLISEARKNFHSFDSYLDETNALIYNYNPERSNDFYEQIYFFPKPTNSSKPVAGIAFTE